MDVLFRPLHARDLAPHARDQATGKPDRDDSIELGDDADTLGQVGRIREPYDYGYFIVRRALGIQF